MRIETLAGAFCALVSLVSGAADLTISDFGAKADGTMCSASIARAIDACAAAGGGRVVVPTGEWLTGAVTLKSNVELHLDEGATLLFSDRLEDHLPAVRTTYEGIECMGYSAHVYAYGATNIAVTGKGTLKTLRPSYSWEFYKAHKDDPDFRQAHEAAELLRRWGADGVPIEKRLYTENRGPRARMPFIHLGRCRGIRLEGFRIVGSPMWTVHLYRSSDIVARGLDIMARGLNTDGFDIEMSRDVLIENCTLDQQDDGFTIKAGKDAAGRAIGEPTENVLIRNCHVKDAHGILVIGSEVSAGVRNVRLENCTADRVTNGFYIKTNPYRGGYVEDVWFENVTCSNALKAAFSIETDVNYGQLPLPGTEECLTRIRNIHVRNATFCKATHKMKLTGDARRPVENVTVDGLEVGYVRRKETNVVENVRGLVVDGEPYAVRPAQGAGPTDVQPVPQSLRAPEGVRKANYDESKVAPYTLENPLDYTREQILDIFAKNMYGEEPPKPKPGECTWKLRHEAVDLAGFAIRRNYKMTFSGSGKRHDLWWSLFLPRHAQRKSPLVMILNGNGSDEFCFGLSSSPTNRNCFSVATLIARGYAVLTARYTDISPDIQNDDKENYESGVFTVWPKRDPKRTDNITSLGAWAWTMSRGLDMAETVPEIDAKKTVVTGYSRLGKVALLAAARDERFAVCVPVQTGGGGVPLAKRDFGENVARECWRFPHWFCRAYDRFAATPEKTLFFDQHLLLASIAPRALLVPGFDGHWFDARGEYLAVRAASPMWEKRYGLPGLPAGGFPDNYDTSLIGPYLGYVRRTEEHGYAAIDWKWALDFADKVFAKTESELLVHDWQPQIDAAVQGNGKVKIPGGRWLSKPLRLPSNFLLRLDEGAQLVAEPGLAGPLVSATGATNVTVCGAGEIVGGVAFENCRRVNLREFRLRDAKTGAVQLKDCEEVQNTCFVEKVLWTDVDLPEGARPEVW